MSWNLVAHREITRARSPSALFWLLRGCKKDGRTSGNSMVPRGPQLRTAVVMGSRGGLRKCSSLGIMNLAYTSSQPAKSSFQSQRRAARNRTSVGRLGKYSPASKLCT